MLKSKKEFIQDQLNTEHLTPLQWDGIMRAMENYAEHYYEEKLHEQGISKIISSIQWMFRKIDKAGDTPAETVRMLLMLRKEIDSIEIK